MTIQNALAERAFSLCKHLDYVFVERRVMENEIIFLANTLMNASQTPE